jgi:hypothetical protein
MLKAEYGREASTPAKSLGNPMNTIAPSTGEIVFPRKVCSALTGRVEGKAGP